MDTAVERRGRSPEMNSREMEEPLITDGSRGAIDWSGSGSSSGSDGDVGGRFGRRVRSLRLAFFKRKTRSEAITSGSAYQRAAALVDLAEDGIGLPEEVLEDHKFGLASKFYFIYIKLDFLWSLNLFALILLNFLEKPLWCLQKGHSCQDREYYYLGQLPYLTSAESLIYEGLTLVILIVYALFPMSYEGHNHYWKNRINILKVGLSILLVCDMLVYILFMLPTFVTLLPFRIAPYVRVVFLALSIRELRSCAITLAGMFVMYLNILALSVLFLLFSSWLAYVTFEDTEQGMSVFTSFGATLYQMFVLFTTSNNPDVWIPAYKNSRWSCIFFILYVLVGVYFITNLILAVVYDSFKAQLARQVVDMDCTRKRILGKAFSIVDKFKRGFLDEDQCSRLFKELNNYRSLPKISKEDFELIFRELDASGDFKINMEEFEDLCNAIAMKFQKEPKPSWLENYPSFYHCGASKNLKDFVMSPVFGKIVAFVLVLNGVAVVIETTLDIQNNSGQIFWQKVEFLLGWLYVIEVILKIYSFGFDKYWMEGQNQFDFVVTWIIVVGETATFFIPKGVPLLSNGEWIRYLLIARMLRLLRLLMHVQRYRAFLTTFLTLIPSLMPYLGTIFCVMCIYCSLGLQLFGGIVNSGNPDIKGTDLADNDYLLFNFNDYPNGMVTLFNLLVMGNWQAWMQSYNVLTGTSWTLVYFVSFYIIAILLLLNLVLAFVLEAFFTEMELEACQSTQEEDDVNAPSTNVRRRIGMKSRSRTVDILLHRILCSELTKSSNA